MLNPFQSHAQLTSAELNFIQGLVGLSYAQGDILYYNGTILTNLGPGVNGQFLKTQGAGANPVWTTIAGGGDLLAANNLSDLADAATARTNLGLGSMAVATATDYVAKSLFDAQTVLAATSDNTPAALTVTEQTVVGRVTGGNIAAIAIDSDISSVSANHDTIPSAKAVKTVTDGKENFHGVQSIGAVTFADASHILSVATITYWYVGVSYTSAVPITCDIDSFETLTDNTLYYFYFDDATGTLKCNDSGWDLKTKVPVATVFWNGSSGAITREWHNHTRDLDWHTNAHLTIGARYYSGLSLTTPTPAADNTLQIESGAIYDEDLVSTISQQTTCRVWYQVSSGVYTFVDSSLPYAGTSGNPQYLDTDTYTLTNTPDNDWVNMWVYATPDISRPIHIIPTQATKAHSTITAARAEQPPALSGLNLAPEMKLIYKFIYDGDGNFIESVDYRNASVLPAGGTASSSASSVSFVPAGNIASTTVQTAIEELDTEKAPITSPTFVTDIYTPLIVAGADMGSTADVAGVTFTGANVVWVDDGSSTTVEHGIGRAENTTATTGAVFFGARSRGTLASKTIVQADDNLFDVVAVGYDGTDYAQAARIDIEVDGTPGSNDMPGRIVFKTTPDGSQSPAEVLRLAQDKKATFSGNVELQSTDAGATGLTIDLYHNSASPAGNDVVGQVTFSGEDSAGNKQTYSYVKGVITSPTSTSEVGQVTIGMTTGGTSADRITFYADSVVPVTNDTYTLGSATNQFSDLFLAEGGVINWDNGDVTLTQSNNTLTLAGGDLTVPTLNVNTSVQLAENASIDLDAALSADGKYSGTCITGTAGAALAFGDIVYYNSSSKWVKADADAAATAGPVLVGLVVLAASGDTEPTKVLLMGNIREDDWNWTVGGAIYISGGTAGTLTQTAPTTTDHVVRVVGWALSADSMMFMPSTSHITHTG